MLQISVGNDKEISLTAHQKKCVTLLELKGKQLNDIVVDIIVPYAVTLPLTLMARAGRDRSNYEKNKTKNGSSRVRLLELAVGAFG